MMTVLKAVHEDKLALDQPVTIQAKYQNNDSGCFQHLQPGFTLQLRDVLVMMIIVSDNTCTGTVVDMVGLDAINALSHLWECMARRTGMASRRRDGRV